MNISLKFLLQNSQKNYGVLRDTKTGAIVYLAPNCDNNIALISRGYPVAADRSNDRLISFFFDLLNENEETKKLFCELQTPTIAEDMILECISDVEIEVDKKIITDFILNGQIIILNQAFGDNITESVVFYARLRAVEQVMQV